MEKILVSKTIDRLITFNLFIILFSGLGFAFSILGSEKEIKLIDNSNIKVLGLTLDEKCIDSDASSLNKSIYIKGQVNLLKKPDNKIIYKDHCIDENKLLVEEFCEFDKSKNTTTVKSIVYECEKGCKDGACIVN